MKKNPEHPVPKAKVIIYSIHFRQSKGPQELDLALNDHVKQRKQITYFHMMGTSIIDPEFAERPASKSR